MAAEVHSWNGKEYVVRDGVFEYGGLRWCVRSGQAGFSDCGIVTNCVDHDGFSYWNLGDCYSGIVVDVGAHIGGFTCAVARMARHVFAYEACQENYELLLANVAINGLKNVTCFRRAAGDGAEKLLGTCLNENTGGASFINNSGRPVELVPGIGLAEMLDGLDDVGLMKLDCEGGEYGLFLGQPRDLVRRIAVIASEVHWHPALLHNDFVSCVEECGYKSEVHSSRADSCKMANFWRIE